MSDAHSLSLALPSSDTACPVQAFECNLLNIWPDGPMQNQATLMNTANCFAWSKSTCEHTGYSILQLAMSGEHCGVFVVPVSPRKGTATQR